MGEMSDSLKNLANNLEKMVESQKLNALKKGQKTAISLGAAAKISNNRYLDVDFKKDSLEGGTIDLKTKFEHGSSARRKKNGGWYTIVPIRYKVSSLSNSAYKQVKDLREDTSFNSTYIDILYGGQPLEEDSLSAFGITTQVHGGNLTRVAQGDTRGAYYAFRTVSDKSAPNSWILLRDRAKAQAEETDKLAKIGQSIQDTLTSYESGF